MDNECKMFLLDFLNLVFGTLKSKETTYFWDQFLIPETIKAFKIPDAIKYHSYQEPLSTLLNKNSVNLNAMFYALYYLFGFKIDDIGNSNDLYNTKVKDYFDKFRTDVKPFGDPMDEENYSKVQINGRSKTFSLRNIPYKELYE